MLILRTMVLEILFWAMKIVSMNLIIIRRGLSQLQDCINYKYEPGVKGYSLSFFGYQGDTQVVSVLLIFEIFLCGYNDKASIKIKDYIKRELSENNVDFCNCVGRNNRL